MHKYLMAERKAKNYTQKDIADAIGMKVATYGRKERGESFFELEEAAKISVFLETPLNILFPDLFYIDSDKNAQ